MTAEQITESKSIAPRSPRLRLVQAPVARVSTLGFVGIVVLLIAAGLSGVMVVSTTANAQSRELSQLRQEAIVLGYEADGLESQYQRVTSTNALALRAAELGLVPNPYPAFVDLSNGGITGEPIPVVGDEMPFLRGATPRVPPNPDPADPPAHPEPVEPNLTAANQAGEDQ